MNTPPSPRGAIACSLCAGLAIPLSLAAGARVTVQPVDHGRALANPGMGWQFHHFDNNLHRYGVHLAPSDTVAEFPGGSILYLRLPWAHLEPQEGRYEWSIVDSPAQRWIARGHPIALRFTCSESSTSIPSATPAWVRAAGAKGYTFTTRQGIDPEGAGWEPDFDDPIFLEKLDRFLAAAAARYDGHPSVAFVDIGSFGIWGEGHTGASTRLPYSGATVRRHIDLHLKHFKRTQLALSDDAGNHGRGTEVMLYARDRGIALRDDSILVQGGPDAYYKAWLAPQFWPTRPVILEMQHYAHAKDRDRTWGDGSRYLDAVEDYHASYVSVHHYPREFLAENRDLIDRINLRLGYRIQLVEASWPAAVPAGGEWEIGYRWRNGGVAPCLPGGFPALTLLDAAGGIAAVFVDEDFDVRVLPVGPPGQAHILGREPGARFHTQASLPYRRFRLPAPHLLPPGDYEVRISIGDRLGTPRLALPLDPDDGSRRYPIGRVTVLSPDARP